MAEPDLDLPLSCTAASAAVADIGWRYLLGTLAVSVPVRSLAQGSAVAAAAAAAEPRVRAAGGRVIRLAAAGAREGRRKVAPDR